MKIRILLPYLGRLPEYFPAFAHSLKHFRRNYIYIYIITDDERIADYTFPPFVEVEQTTYETLDARFRKVCNAPIYSGYKLCDYKPIYGSVFREECKGYDYWGYCDADIMFGDIEGWLESVDFTKYDRIGQAGHLTLYRNVPEVNELFRRKVEGLITFDHVSSTTFPCYFDEAGMNKICEACGIAFLKYNHVANVEPLESLHFKTYNHVNSKENLCQLFVWENGHTFVYNKRNGKVVKDEYAYIHYPYRSGLGIREELSNFVLLTHEGFYNFDINKIEDYFERYGRADSEEERVSFRKQQYGKWKANRYKRFIFEIKRLGILKTLGNMLYRLRSTKLSLLFLKQ